MKRNGSIPWVLAVVLVAVGAGFVAACGSSGHSVSGPSTSSGVSTALVQGQVVDSQSAATGESVLVVALQTTLGMGVAEALAGTPVAGATVSLLRPDNSVLNTTTTDANGQFVFRNVAPGVYTVKVVVGTTVKSVSVTVGAGDQAIVGVATGGASSVDVVAMSTDVYNNDAQLGHALNIADAGGRCDLVEVTRLRESGLGWGNIAQRCSVSPGVIGLGRSNLSDDDLDTARTRNGQAPQHGKGGKGNSGNKKG